MEGMNFLLVNEQGKPMGHGIIASRINENRYLCTFLRQPQVSRVVGVDEIATWNLFPNQDAMNAFVAALPKSPGTPPPPPSKEPASKKPASKSQQKRISAQKKASKKKASKKTGK